MNLVAAVTFVPPAFFVYHPAKEYPSRVGSGSTATGLPLGTGIFMYLMNWVAFFVLGVMSVSVTGVPVRQLSTMFPRGWLLSFSRLPPTQIW